MSTTLLEPGVQAPVAQVPDKSRRFTWAWLREPLLHFIVLGGVLFAIDSAIASREGDPHTIVIDAQVDAQAIQVFKDARGHAPNEQELYALRRVWLDNEVLYREGLALGLEKGDKSIRERVIFKSLSVVDASLKRPPVEGPVLRKWFESHRAKYDEPARFDFEEAVLAGERSEAAVRAFADALNQGHPEDNAGDIQAGLRVFTDRPQDNLVQSYGAELVTALENAPPGEWRAFPTRDGLRVMRLRAISPAKPANFEDLEGVVLQDWTDAVMAEQRSEAVRALARKYTVQIAETR